MSWKAQCVCDECGRPKGASNGWLIADAIIDTRAEVLSSSIVFSTWTENGAKTGSHLCGMECAQKLLSRFMADKHRDVKRVPESPGTEAAS